MTAFLQRHREILEMDRRWFAAFLGLQAVLLAGGLFVSELVLYLAAAGIASGLFAVSVLLYPWLIVPIVIVTTALDFTGRLVETTALGVPLTGFHLAFGMMLVAFLVNVFFRRRVHFPPFELGPPFALFLGSIAVSLTYSPNQPEATISFVRTFFLVTFLYLSQVMIDSKRAVDLVAISMGLSIVGGAVLGLFQIVTERFYLPASFVIKVGANTPRATGTFHNPNTFGTFLMVGVVFLFALLLACRLAWWKRFLLLVVLGVGITGLAVTFSRANWLATLVGIMVVLFMLKKLRYLFYLFAVGFLAVLAVKEFVPIADYIFQRFLSIFSLIEEFGSAGRASSSARIYFVIAAFRIFLDHPLLGAGWRAFPVIFDQYKPVDFPYWLPTRESHTLVATIMAELGLVGLVASAWIIWRTMRYAFRSLKEIQDEYLRAVMIGLIAVFIAFQVSLSFTAEFANNFLWLFTGLIFAVPRIDEAMRKT